LKTNLFIRKNKNFSIQSYVRLFHSDPKDPQKIVIEFSSPNICKPFHAGHLRSTIIGNFISNLYAYLSNDVIRLNYLGDWGTQFGLLKVGLELDNVLDSEIKAHPIQTLYNAYVQANKKKETEPSIGDRARSIFVKLENGDEDTLKNWEKWRDYTLIELTQIYGRLGIKFDHYHWESMYSRKSINKVINELEAKNLIIKQTDGKKVIKIKDNRKVPIMKSDETTLYLTRDLAALIDRHEKYGFDRIIYVVDNGQNDHFTSLFDIAQQLNPEIFHSRLTHVKFGRVKGMSTRKGNVVFLKDILDEAKHIMKQKQLYSPSKFFYPTSKYSAYKLYL
jgi:arginyl-tRNA synthetase